MSRLLIIAAFLVGTIGLSVPTPPAQAGDFRTTTNVQPGSSPHYSKHWRKRGKARHYGKRGKRSYRPRRESRDYLVTFPHTHVDLGTNM